MGLVIYSEVCLVADDQYSFLLEVVWYAPITHHVSKYVRLVVYITLGAI